MASLQFRFFLPFFPPSFHVTPATDAAFSSPGIFVRTDSYKSTFDQTSKVDEIRREREKVSSKIISTSEKRDRCEEERKKKEERKQLDEVTRVTRIGSDESREAI